MNAHAGAGYAPPPSEYPFVQIKTWQRVLLIVYIVIFNIFMPVVDVLYRFPGLPYAEWRALATFATYAIPLLPLIFYRPIYGWLHPLIFPVALGVASSLVRNPWRLQAPFYMTGEPPSELRLSDLLVGYSPLQVADADLTMRLCFLLATVCYYFAFFTTPIRKPLNISFVQPRAHQLKLGIVIVVGFAFFAWIVASAGGLEAWMMRWSGGRHNLTAQGVGWTNPVLRISLLACLVWYMIDDKAPRNPFFLVASGMAIIMQFFIGGSRSSVVMAMVYFLAIYLARNRRLPLKTAAIVGVVAYLLIGTLGAVRASLQSGSVDWSPLTEFTFSAGVDKSSQALADRYREGDSNLAVFVKVPAEVDYLYGKTYVGPLTFFIPRAVWSGKPRGAGIENTRQIRGGGGGGVPIRPETEAYWNFSFLGVIGVFLLFGMLHKWLAVNYLYFGGSLPFLFIYLITLIRFSPGSNPMTDYIQMMAPVIVVFFWLGVIRVGRRRAGVRGPSPRASYSLQRTPA